MYGKGGIGYIATSNKQQATKTQETDTHARTQAAEALLTCAILLVLSVKATTSSMSFRMLEKLENCCTGLTSSYSSFAC